MNIAAMSRRICFVIGIMAVGGLALFSAACANVSAEDIKGILEAADGREVTITMDDGSTVRISVTKAADTTQAEDLVGQPVTVRVRTDKEGKRELVSVKKDEHRDVFFGVIDSIASDKLIVDDRTFDVDSATELEPGLEAGMTVKVTFSTESDGSLLALRVASKHADNGVRDGGKGEGRSGEDDDDDDEFTGVVTSIGDDSITVGGRTFEVTADTEKEGTIEVGAKVEVEFTTLGDGTLVADEIEVKKKAPVETPGTNPVPPVTPVSYAATIQPLFDQYCIGCHGASAAEGIDLRTYDSAIASDSIVPGDAESSDLYTALIESGDEQMPPGGSIPSADIQAIANWINQGAQDN